MSQLSIDKVQSEISQCLSKKYNMKSKDLPSLIAKLRGKLPRGFEADLKYLFVAQARIKHPKRRGQVDMRKIEAIRRTCIAKLDTIDLERDQRRAKELWKAEIAARFLLFVAGVVGLLYWLDMIV